jgi:hypothetical protein
MFCSAKKEIFSQPLLEGPVQALGGPFPARYHCGEWGEGAGVICSVYRAIVDVNH